MSGDQRNREKGMEGKERRREVVVGNTEDLGPQRREGTEEEKKGREREEERKVRREGGGK